MPPRDLKPVPSSASKVTRMLLKELGIGGLFPPQLEALEAGVERGESILLAAPTGAGKTLVALIAVANALSRSGSRAFYVSPLKSIAQEKFREFSILSKLGYKVRLSVGDYASGPPDADVIISTYEKLDAMLRSHRELLSTTSILVVDEVHMVGDPDRGPVLESIVARLRSWEGGLQIVALSATVPNAFEIAEWLGAKAVVSSWRPVPLKEGVFKDYIVHYSDGDSRVVSRVTGHPDIDISIETVGSGGQVLVFTQSRRRAVSLARRAAGRIPVADDRSARELARDLASASWGPSSMREELSSLVAKGVAYHHAGLPLEARRLVEDGFRSGIISVVYSTPTLAAGVNLPARVVVVDSYYRYREGAPEPIKVAEYKQLAGRAGRPGYDEEGEAIIIAAPYDSVEELITGYVKAEPEPVESRLAGLRGLRHMILGLVASGEAASVDEVMRVVAHTLYYRQRGDMGPLLEYALEDLESWGLIRRNGGELEATLLGWEVARLYLDPETVPRVSGAAEAIKSWGELELLYLVTVSPDMPLLPAPPREAEEVYREAEARSPALAELVGLGGPEELRRVKTALALHDWINEASDDIIMDKWGAAPGDIASLRDTGEWIASSLSRIAGYLGIPEEAGRKLRILALRVRYGVREELLQLAQLPGVGRVRARRLYEAGYKSIHDLAVADPRELMRIRGIGPSTVASIMEALGRRSEAESLKRAVEAERKGLLAFMGGGDGED